VTEIIASADICGWALKQSTDGHLLL